MNELAVQQTNLPAMPTEGVKQYLDNIGAAIDTLKAKRSVAKNMNISQSDIDEMDRQIREYNAEKVLAQIELGKRTAEMEKNTDFHGNRFSEIRSAENTKNKSDQLADLGITPQRAQEYEQMAKHEETVTQYIEEKLIKGETPTKNGAMARIKEEESYIDGGDMSEKRKPPLNPGGFTKERRKQREMIDAIYEDMKSTDESRYDANAFVEELNCIVDSFVSSFKSMIVNHSTMLNESIKDQIREISNTVFPKINKEVLKNL